MSERTTPKRGRATVLKRASPPCIYLALAASMTWPLPMSPASGLPLGTSSAATVPLFNAWTIWWNADRLTHGLAGYWDAPIFAPGSDSFTLSEPQPATWIVAPFVWWSGPVLASNMYLWLALVLNGVTAFALLRSLRLRWFACVAGGCLAETLPFVQWQLGVLQLVPMCGVFWTLSAVRAFSHRPVKSRGALLGVSVAATGLACGHTVLLLSVLLAVAAVWYPGEKLRRGATWSGLVVAGTCATLLLGPVAWQQRNALGPDSSTGEDGRRRTTLERQRLSLQLSDYLSNLPWKDAGASGGRVHYWPASPGWLKLAAAVCGAAFGLTRRRWRRWTAFVLTFLVASVLLSLGPNLSVAGWRPFETLADVWPGMAHVRNVFRFAQFAQIAVVLLASLACHAVLVAARRYRHTRGRGSRALHWTAPLLVVLALAETAPSGTPTFPVPAASPNAEWIDGVRREAQDGSVACIPFSSGNRLKDWERTTLWMHYGTIHGRPLANGYSGYFPAGYLSFRRRMGEFPSAATLRALYDRDVRLCVVERETILREQIERMPAGPIRLEWIAGDDQHSIDVYRLTRAAHQSRHLAPPR